MMINKIQDYIDIAGDNMKNKELLIFVIGLSSLTLLSIIYTMLNPKLGGRDTVLLLGDGTYQIFKSIDIDRNEIYNLTNVVAKENVINVVIKYKNVPEASTIYLIGKEQPDDIEYKYVVLNYNAKSYNVVSELSELNNDERIIFEDLDQFKLPSQ